jgi:hypothetical protein
LEKPDVYFIGGVQGKGKQAKGPRSKWKAIRMVNIHDCLNMFWEYKWFNLMICAWSVLFSRRDFSDNDKLKESSSPKMENNTTSSVIVYLFLFRNQR